MPSSEQTGSRQVDEILIPFLKESNEAEASRLLEQLIQEQASPLIREIVKSHLRGSHGLQNAEDIASEVVLRLVKKLRELQSNPDGQIISSFRGYVAVVTYNACYKHLRQAYPERSRLKDRLKYLLSHQRSFAIWEGKNRQWLCGFASWQGYGAHTSGPGSLVELRDRTQATTGADQIYKQAQRDDPVQLLAAIFNWAGKPIELDDLVDTVAHLWQVTDQVPPAEESQTELPDTQATIDARVEQRLYLERLWAEICDLPLQQRRALLLNLRGAQGPDLTTLLAHARIATLRALTDALGMTGEEFAGIWNELPLDDATIAAKLGVTRQQVINLRNAARKRLSRRMKNFDRSR